MTPEQITLVRRSFAKVLPIAQTAAALFYERLFETEPSTRAMFRGDMKAQGDKLMMTIAAVVDALDDLEPMLDQIRDLARRHVRYGVREQHYDSVGAALLWTLEKGLGAEFTPETRAAWAAAYGLLSGVMIEAARTPVPDAA